MGILAFGSLRTDRGPELEAAIVDWRPATAPFAIEHARYNETRGDAPTLVPVASAGTSNLAEARECAVG
jgi:hypothetical protein